jgi:hypothetical protein
LFAACQHVAAKHREACTREHFADHVRHYPVEQLRQVENRLAAMPQAEQLVVVERLLK